MKKKTTYRLYNENYLKKKKETLNIKMCTTNEMLQHQIKRCTVTHEMYGYNLVIINVTNSQKPCPASLTQKFIHSYTF